MLWMDGWTQIIQAYNTLTNEASNLGTKKVIWQRNLKKSH